VLRNLISAAELRTIAAGGKQALIPANSVLTPSALDIAKELGITLVWEGKKFGDDKKPEGCAAAFAGVKAQEKPAAIEVEPALSAEKIQAIVRDTVGKILKPACANPRVTLVKGKSVVMEKFQEAPPGQTVHLTDVVTSREANLCAGFMSFDKSILPWHLSYDEVDYVMEGTFILQANGVTYTAVPGDVMYIPKDTTVVFGSPDHFSKVFYVTYPANWTEQEA